MFKLPLSSSQRKTLIDLNVALLVVLIMVVGYKLNQSHQGLADLTVTPEPTCNLTQTPCQVQLPDGRLLIVNITPRPLPATGRLSIDVTLPGTWPERVEGDLAGISMNMGTNRFPLVPRDDGAFHA